MTSTVFDKIGTDRELQDHWLRRLIAALIDSLITSAASYIISFIFSLPSMLITGVFFGGVFPFLQGGILVLYAIFMEGYYGRTLGKQFMNLKVTSVDGKPLRLGQTAIRNISKIHGLFWLIDTLIGLGTVGEPHQKYSDRFAKTTVTSTIAKNMILTS